MGLLGLLEPANPEPALADVVVHADAATVEDQGVREFVVPWVSTRRPIAAAVANAVQLTRDVVSQAGQIEVITCSGGRREARVGDTTAEVGVVLVYCTHVGCTVGRFLGVVMTLCL